MTRAISLLSLSLAALTAMTVPVSARQETHDALAARLVAVLPPATAERDGPDPFAVERAADLTRSNPAKSAEISAAFADRARCSDTRRNEGVARVMLAVARSLSDEDLQAMIAFYSGPDHIAAEQISEGSPEWNALLKRYPLTRFGEAMQAQTGALLIDEVMKAEDACEAMLTATLAKQGISE